MATRPGTHRPLARLTARHAPAETARQSSTQRGYGYRWQQFRKRYLSKHPLCVECKAAGRVTLAIDVDHVDPHRGDMEKFWAGPFQGLCHSCHSAKTARGC
jgi:5-methylcytosine-specific restriction protein A